MIIKYPPGPKGHFLFGNIAAFQENALELFHQGYKDHGDIVCFSFGPKKCFLLAHPDQVKFVLKDHPENFVRKARSYRFIRKVLGDGLLTSEGDLWKQQRKIVQGDFLKRQVIKELPRMVEVINQRFNAWDQWAQKSAEINLNREMAKMSFSIFDKIYSGITFTEEEIEMMFDADQFLENQLYYRARHPLSLPLLFPTKDNRQYHNYTKKLKNIAQRIIEHHKSLSPDQGNFFTKLINRDFTYKNGVGQVEKQKQCPMRRSSSLRQEILTFYAAAYKTTSLGLSYAWYLLSQKKDVSEKFFEEVKSVLGSRIPTIDDMEKLKYTEQIFKEALRLYPPTWLFGRSAVQSDEINGYRIPAKTLIAICPYVTHRHAGFWENPEEFCPERFNPENEKKQHPLAYIPFGGGAHQCIGYHLTLIEAKLIMSMVAQRFRFHFPSTYRLKLIPKFLLSPQESMRVYLTKTNGIT